MYPEKLFRAPPGAVHTSHETPRLRSIPRVVVALSFGRACSQPAKIRTRIA